MFSFRVQFELIIKQYNYNASKNLLTLSVQSVSEVIVFLALDSI